MITMRVTDPFWTVGPDPTRPGSGSVRCHAMASSSGLYAAYGSNMDPEQMLERCPHSPAAGTGWLSGWRLTFGGEEHGWDGSLPMIVPEKGAQVFVALYDVSP